MFNTRAEYRISCEHLVYILVFVPISSLVQLTAEASFITCVAVIIILVLIGVRPTSFHISFLFHRVLYRGTYDGIERGSQAVTGTCFRGLLTSTWSA